MNQRHEPTGAALAVMYNMVLTIIPGSFQVPSGFLYAAELNGVVSQPVLQDVPVVIREASCVPRKKFAVPSCVLHFLSSALSGGLRRNKTRNILTAQCCR